MLNQYAKLFAEMLEKKGFNYTSHIDSDGDSCISFPYQGKTARLFFTGNTGSYLSIYLVYESVPEEKFIDIALVCNELNNQYKWITFYVDKDNDIILHDDAILSAENAADEAMELLVRMLTICTEIKPKIMKAIYA